MGGTSQAVTVRLRFYDGKNVIEGRVTAVGTELVTFDKSFVQLNYPASTSRYFSLSQNFGMSANPSEWINVSGSWQSPCDVVMDHYWGGPFASGEVCGIGPYVDPAVSVFDKTSESFALYDPSYQVLADNTTLSAQVGKKLAGFAIITAPAWAGCLEYNSWVHRNLAPKTRPAWQYRTPHIAYQHFSSNTLTWYYLPGEIENRAAILKSRNYPVELYEIDAGWFDWPGDWNFSTGSTQDGHATPNFANFNGSGRTVCQYLKDQGFHAGCWVGFHVRYESAAYQSNDSSAFIPGTTWGGVSALWSPWTANGRAGIEAIAQKIYDHGFEYARLDFLYYNFADMFAAVKVFWDKMQTLKPDFFLELHHPFMAPFADAVRTNDVIGYPADWKNILKKKQKIGMVHAPYCVIDCDGNGSNSFDYTVTTEILIDHMRMQFGYGRPEIYFLYGAWPTGVSDYYSGQLQAAELFLLDLMTRWDTLPKEIPQRSITNDINSGYSTLLTYSDGSTVTWDEATGEISITSNAPLAVNVVALTTNIPLIANIPTISVPSSGASVYEITAMTTELLLSAGRPLVSIDKVEVTNTIRSPSGGTCIVKGWDGSVLKNILIKTFTSRR